jgi:hypothetical protein
MHGFTAMRGGGAKKPSKDLHNKKLISAASCVWIEAQIIDTFRCGAAITLAGHHRKLFFRL